MVTKREKNTKKPKQQKGHSNEDVYLKLKSVEKKIDSSSRIQRVGIFSALGVAFIFLALSYYLAFLQSTDKDTTTFYLLNIPAFLAMGAFLLFYTSTSKPKNLKKPKMTKEQEIRRLEKSTANDHGFLSIGLFTAALWAYSTSNDRAWITLTAIGAIFALSSLYFFFIHRWKRQKMINIASSVRIDIKYIAWCLGLVLLGKDLIQTQLNWAALPGQICMYAGLFVLFCGFCKAVKELSVNLKLAELVTIIRRKIMGSKGRKNVKKTKKAKEPKGAQQADKKK